MPMRLNQQQENSMKDRTDTLIPIVIEKEGSNERSFDIFSRLLRDRIIFINGEVHNYMSDKIIAQLLFLEAEDSESDICLYIDSPGGSVYAGLSIYNTMKFVKPDIVTVCTGLAASMGAFLLSAGTKGKRIALAESSVMIHEVSSGTVGKLTDQKIDLEESERLNKRLAQIQAANCGITLSKHLKTIRDDTWLPAKEAKEYGLIDHVIKTRKELSKVFK